MAKIDLPKGSGKRLKVREKSVKSQGILKWILSGNPAYVKSRQIKIYLFVCLLVLSADNFCKQFGPRSGPTKMWA